MKTFKPVPALSIVAILGLAMTSVSANAQSFDSQNRPCPTEVKNDRTAGTIIGALAGGALGNAFSHGSARGTGTALGMVAGGVIGNQMGQTHGKYICAQQGERVATRYDDYDAYDRPVVRERVVMRPVREYDEYDVYRIHRRPHRHYVRVVYHDVYRDRDGW
jgi:uncharacterized protein YcfJ